MDYNTACDFIIHRPGTEAGWRKHPGREAVFSSPHLTVDEVSSSPPSLGEDVAPLSWIVARRKPAVVVAPMTPDGKLLLVQQERIPVERTLWEFPAGQVEETGDDLTARAIVDTALRELEEEAGYCPDPETGGLIPFGCVFTSQGFTDEHIYQFLLRNAVTNKVGTAHEDGECIVDCRAFSPGEIQRMIASSEICDGMTLGLCARLWSLGFIS